MSLPLLEALARKPLARPPVWIMRQAGRYLPEYRELRQRYSFQEAVSTPGIASEITLQPIRRYGMDAAVIFADIMTPLEAMGVDMTFDPGPKLRPHSLAEVADLPALEGDRVGFVAETVRMVRDQVPSETAVIGFAGAPLTLLAYLIEGGGSKEFLSLRSALLSDPYGARQALEGLSRSMHTYLTMQIDAGADAVQLFDSWAGILDRSRYLELALPAASATLADLSAPRIYFAPGGSHLLDLQPEVGADGFGVDWRIPIDQAWMRLGDVAIQGNLDPAVLLSDPATIRDATRELLDLVDGRPGHILNLGHGISRHTPPEHVAALVEAVRQR